MRKVNIPTLYTLQALRAVAALLVLFYHATQFLTTENGTAFGGFFLFGFSGVHIFFVLSGFIIFLTNYKNIDQPKKFLGYMSKRFLRIYPVYWLILFFVLIGSIFFGNLDLSFSNLYKNVILYSSPTSLYNPIAWTLSFELWFYLILGTLVLNKRFGVVVLVIWFLGIVYNQLTNNSPSFLPAFVFHKYSILFYIGLTTSYIAINSIDLTELRKKLISSIAMSIGVIFFTLTSVYVLILKITNWDTWIITLGFGIASGGFMLSCLSSRLEFFFKKQRFLIFAGDASYSLYLLHYVLIYLMGRLFHKYYVNAGTIKLTIYMTIMCSFIILVSFIFHKFVERPLLKYSREKLLSLKII